MVVLFLRRKARNGAQACAPYRKPSILGRHYLRKPPSVRTPILAPVYPTQLAVHFGLLEDDQAILIEPRSAPRAATCKALLAHLPERRLEWLIVQNGLPRHNAPIFRRFWR